MKKKYLFLIPIIVIIIVIILLVIPKNNYDYSDLEVLVKTKNNKETKVNLDNNEKNKIQNKLKRLSFSEVRNKTDCLISGNYIISFNNNIIEFDDDCSIVFFKSNKDDEYKEIHFSKSLKKYIINLAKERVK